MISNEYKTHIVDIISHSHGGFSHHTLARTLAYNLKLSNIPTDLVDCCLEFCRDYEAQGILTCHLLSDDDFYFSHNSNY